MKDINILIKNQTEVYYHNLTNIFHCTTQYIARANPNYLYYINVLNAGFFSG